MHLLQELFTNDEAFKSDSNIDWAWWTWKMNRVPDSFYQDEKWRNDLLMSITNEDVHAISQVSLEIHLLAIGVRTVQGPSRGAEGSEGARAR